MAEREVLEVETPVLSHATVTDTQLDSFNCEYSSPQTTLDKTLYLQTSPEYAMKRLLASGTGAIYQISKVFRNEEQGKYHNPEFTMLEWYQPGYDHHQLMAELESFLGLFAMSDCEKTSYADIFTSQTGLDPHTCNTNELVSLAEEYGLSSSSEERPVLLDFIFSHKIVSTLGNTNPLFVYDYPACQSALAKLSDKLPKVAERFELFLSLFAMSNCEKTSYADIFARQTGLDPHTCDTNELVSLAEGYGLSSSSEERSVLLDFIFSHKIASTLGNTNPLFVYDYPACLSALAKLSDKSPKVAERFELFINGMEIANGFHELTNADEQLGRFKEDLALRNKAKRPTLPIDHLFMDALKQGLPDCAGVAVGIDRLLMAITGIKDIREILTFPIENA
jgi:elongation factor P--beta-lysine ligase